MKLIDLLEVVSENQMVVVWNEDSVLLDRYDGRDSIDEKYNECPVTWVACGPKKWLHVCIKEG